MYVCMYVCMYDYRQNVTSETSLSRQSIALVVTTKLAKKQQNLCITNTGENN